MKNFIIVFFLTMVASYSMAQTWNFIKANERYHFQHSDDDFPKNTIFVDSFAFAGSDSVFYLNRLFLPCDTCELVTEFNKEFTPYFDNQAGFLQRELIYSQVSSTVVLSNPQQNIIKLPNLGIKSWWFNKEENQKATLDTIVYEQVLGVNDSVALISINGEPQIKIAKSLGLIQYFEYKLVGLENAKLGEVLPGWKDFYDFEVGDVLQYYNSLYQFGSVPPAEFELNKFTITDLESSNDSIFISWDKVGFHTYWLESEQNENNQIDYATLSASEGEFDHESGKWIFEKNGIAGSYHNQLLKVNAELGVNLRPDYVNAQYVKSGDVISLKSGKHFKLLENAIGYIENTSVDQTKIEFEFLDGLGKVYYGIHDFVYDWDQEEILIGYVKHAEDTSGFVFDDAYSSVIDTNTVSNRQLLKAEVYVFPNPSMVSIAFNLGNEKKAFIELYSLEGRLIEKFVAQNMQLQDMQHLSSGTYIINIQFEDRSEQLKWVKY